MHEIADASGQTREPRKGDFALFYGRSVFGMKPFNLFAHLVENGEEDLQVICIDR